MQVSVQPVKAQDTWSEIMDKKRIQNLYKRLENVGMFDEVNVLLWERVTGAARTAYAEGKADGYAQAVKELKANRSE